MENPPARTCCDSREWPERGPRGGLGAKVSFHKAIPPPSLCHPPNRALECLVLVCCPGKRRLNPWVRLGNLGMSFSCTQRHSPSHSLPSSLFPLPLFPFLSPSSLSFTFPLLSQWFVNLFCCCCWFFFQIPARNIQTPLE